MKSCPKCKSVYYDETLEFCTEDGSHLIQVLQEKDEVPTIVSHKINNALADKTLELPNISPSIKDTVKVSSQKELNPTAKIDAKITNFKEKASYQGLRAIEIVPIILALAHNYWQWLYLNKLNYSDTLSFLISINFLVWFLLLFLGLISCFAALKYGKNKDFAVTSMIILAINLLLSIVPLK